MKNRFLVLGAAILLMTSVCFSQAGNKATEQLATKISRAFLNKRFAPIDSIRPRTGQIKFVVEHSLSGAKDSKSFTSMKLAGDWLFRRRSEVGVNAGDLTRCLNGTCTFQMNGLLHNNLYLKKLTYGFSNGKPFVKTVYFVDGD